MIFGFKSEEKGIVLDGFRLKVVSLNDYSKDDLLVHDVNDRNLAMLICEMTYNESLPTPYGVFYKESKPTYDELFTNQVNEQIKTKGNGELKDLIYTKNTWVVS